MHVRLFLSASMLAIASPALADHSGHGTIGGNGGSINVISPDPLALGEGAIGLRLTFIKPHQRSDAELAALAAEHVHAHNADYLLNASVGLAFGATDRLTLSAEMPMCAAMVCAKPLM